jgi:uncharacterized membrane protein
MTVTTEVREDTRTAAATCSSPNMSDLTRDTSVTAPPLTAAEGTHAAGEPSRAAWMRVRELAAPVAVWLASLVYVVVLSSESISAHRSFVTGFDTALYDQLLWLLANGHEPFSTIVTKPILADHFQPGLALLTPIYWLGADVPALLVVQSVALAATGPALYALARASGARPSLAVLPALLWIACPFVARLNLWEFRPTAFVSVLLVLSVLGAVQGRLWLLGATAVIALSLKEDVALVYLALGVVLAIRGPRRTGMALAAASAAWFAVATFVIRSGSGSLDAFGRRFAGDRGDSVPEALAWMLQHPVTTAGDVARESLLYLVALFVATGGLALLAPLWIVLALPTAAHNALSAYEPQHLLSFHYHQLTMTGLFIAAALGVGRLQSAGRGMRLGAAAGVTAAAILAVAAGSWAHAHSTEGIRLPRNATRAALALVPPDAPLAASPHLLPQVSQRAEVYPLPTPFLPLDIGSSLTEAELAARARRVEYVLFRESDMPEEYAGTPESVLAMLEREGFVPIRRAGLVTVFRRSRGS